MGDSSGQHVERGGNAPGAPHGKDLYELVERLYPICRSITGDGVRQSLEVIGDYIPLSVIEVPSGTAVFDWTVPREWNIRTAYVRDPAGKRVIDFRESNLHVVSYSIPVHTKLPLEELRTHLHTLPEHPDWIPYRTSYYSESWGFCVTQKVYDSLQRGDRFVADGRQPDLWGMCGARGE